MKRIVPLIPFLCLLGCNNSMTPTNTSPTTGTIQITPSAAGLVTATTFSLTEMGVTDSDNDTLTFAWDFGDSTTGSGATVTHAYSAAGTFTVKLTANDGHNPAILAAQTTVTIRTVTGNWSGTVTCVGNTCSPTTRTATLNLTQAGLSVSGTCADSHSGTTGPVVVQSFAIDPTSGQFAFTGNCNAGFEQFGMKYDPVADVFNVSNWDSPTYAGTLTRH